MCVPILLLWHSWLLEVWGITNLLIVGFINGVFVCDPKNTKIWSFSFSYYSGFRLNFIFFHFKSKNDNNRIVSFLKKKETELYWPDNSNFLSVCRLWRNFNLSVKSAVQIQIIMIYVFLVLECMSIKLWVRVTLSLLLN